MGNFHFILNAGERRAGGEGDCGDELHAGGGGKGPGTPPNPAPGGGVVVQHLKGLGRFDFW